MVDSDAERQLEAVYLYWVYFVLLKIKIKNIKVSKVSMEPM